MQEDSDSHLDDRRAGERRRRRSGFVLREHRTGFDRRCSGSDGCLTAVLKNTILGLRDRPRALLGLLVAVNALNIADFVLTLNVLAGGGSEANPIMRSLFTLGPVYAGIFKIVAVLLTTWLVWRCRCYRLALQASLIMILVFAAVLVYHIFGLTLS